MFPSRSNQAMLDVALALIKRDLLSTSLTAFGTRHSRSSSCLKICVISWLWGSATTQGWDPRIHTSSHGLYMIILHSLDKMHCLTHPDWLNPDMLLGKVNVSPEQWKPFRGVWVYFRISAMKQNLLTMFKLTKFKYHLDVYESIYQHIKITFIKVFW